MADYFDYLVHAKLISADTAEKVEQAMINHTHHGAGDQGEATLQHGARVLVALVKAEAEAEAEKRVQHEHNRLRNHYHAMEESGKQSLADVSAALNAKYERAAKAATYTWNLLLSARSKRSTYVRLTDLAKANGMPLDDWMAECEPERVEPRS